MSSPQPDKRVLIVDDEDQIRTLLVRLLGAHGYECITAESAAAARRVLEETPVALVLSDVNMPGESGIDLTREVLAHYPETAVVMVTGMDDRSYAEIAIELGAYGYVLKPFKPNELIINVNNALRRRTLEIENRNHREMLEQTVLARTTALRETIAQLERSDTELRRLREETIRRLSWAAEFRNQETGEHIVRMSLYCALLARLAGLDAERAELIRIASPMHDVGKIGIPDRILLKPGRLSEDERRVMEAHTEMGHRILAGSEVELLDLAAEMALTHHERMDGSGYPAGTAGDEIPIEGRICAIADVFDALTSDRVYRQAFQPNEARALMVEGRGTQFDAELLDLFFGAFDDVLAIRRAAGTGTVEQTLAIALAHASATPTGSSAAPPGARPARLAR
jgi:putative two-component system response regulator